LEVVGSFGVVRFGSAAPIVLQVAPQPVEVFLTLRDSLPVVSSSIGVLAAVSGWSWSWSVSVPGAAPRVGPCEHVSSGWADVFASALLRVLGGGVADAFEPVSSVHLTRES